MWQWNCGPRPWTALDTEQSKGQSIFPLSAESCLRSGLSGLTSISARKLWEGFLIWVKSPSVLLLGLFPSLICLYQ